MTTTAISSERFIDVERAVFQNVCKAVSVRTEYAEGDTISAMYHYDEDDKVVAVASYVLPVRQFLRGRARDGITAIARYRVLCMDATPSN